MITLAGITLAGITLARCEVSFTPSAGGETNFTPESAVSPQS